MAEMPAIWDQLKECIYSKIGEDISLCLNIYNEGQFIGEQKLDIKKWQTSDKVKTIDFSKPIKIELTEQ